MSSVTIALGARTGTASPGQVLRRDPVLGGLAVLGLALIAWYALDLGDVTLQVTGFWSVQVALDIGFCALCWRLGRLPMASSTGRFWRFILVAGLAFLAGDAAQAVATWHHPVIESTAGGPVQTALLSVGALCCLAAMLTHPTRLAGRQRLRFGLDAATIMAGVSAFAWYLAVDSGSAGSGGLGGRLLSVGLMLACAFSLIKLTLGGNAPFTTLAGILGGLSGGMVGAGAALAPALVDSNRPALSLAARLVPCVLLLAAPRVQELQLRADPYLLGARRRRPYSRLPYAVVAAAHVLLVMALLGGTVNARVWGVVAGVVLTTALVVTRQIVALSDNGRLQERLRHEASHDPLTGLANRSLFERRQGTRDPADRRPPAADIAVLLIDLDGFKEVNDTHGHHVGDALLCAVAERLRAGARAGDTVARLGGDEFAVLLPDTTEDVARQIATRIDASFAEPAVIGGHELTIRASVGVAAGPADDPDAVVRAADAAMYTMKRTRR
ncbi:hypothetical protein Vau01_093180 [Virgisporangium aurantiacum]|uniref:GGDEF domain-containing protein n=1 Tax=Virgisporangium aurantiacum TaxID=175570 RepID=A0A8J3ZD66_9ACTN|nr:hypothetical protein Vau01_093180 [Virgisporangium aurantiacum]